MATEKTPVKAKARTVAAKPASKASAKAAAPKAAAQTPVKPAVKPVAKPAARPAVKAATVKAPTKPKAVVAKPKAIAIVADDDAGASKEVQKLQRAIVDGLEDVKAQDIRVFSTAHLSPLFERVIIASGTSNRQTRALAASVRDAVRDAGFAKPRIEGEDNGEWIIVDCGVAVVHVMQPAIRQYYTLEDIWGEKPVNMRIGKAPAKKAAAAKPLSRTAARTAAKKAALAEAEKPPAPAKTVARKTAKPAVKAAKPAARAAAGKR